MTYDDAAWHVDSAIENGFESHHGATHIGIFFAWLAHHDLVNPAAKNVDRLVRREITPGQFVLQMCGGEINKIWLTERGAAFTAAVYRRYLASYRSIPAVAEHRVIYAAPDTWALYDAVAPVVDATYQEYLSGRIGQ